MTFRESAKKTAALLKHFGLVAAIRKADIDDIAKAPGIGHKRAQAIVEYLRK